MRDRGGYDGFRDEYSSQNSDDENEWIFDPDFAAMNRSLKRELRDEAEENEIITARSELRSRTVADVAREFRNQGVPVAVTTSHRVFAGHIVYAAGDFFTLSTDEFDVDINLNDVAFLRNADAGFSRKLLQRSSPRGQALSSGPGTFSMQLLDRQSPTERVEIGFQQAPIALLGAITVVAQDHLIMINAQREQHVIPLESISYVIRRGRQSYK